MASPSSPVQSNAYSRASTPSSPHSAAEDELTPRSKIKALLAANFDDDTDDEQLVSKTRQTGEPPRAQIEEETVASASKEGRKEVDRAEDCEDTRDASRGEISSSTAISKPETVEVVTKDSGDAYERVRRQLLAQKDGNSEQNGVLSGSGVNDEEADNAVLPRGKLARRLHESREIQQSRSLLESSGIQGNESNEEENALMPAEQQSLIQESEMRDDKAKDPAKKTTSLGNFLRRKRKPVPALQDHDMDTDELIAQSPQDVHSASNHQEDSMNEIDAPTAHPDRAAASEPELPTMPSSNARFQALVAKKRAERKARETAEEAKRVKRATLHASSSKTKTSYGKSSDISDMDANSLDGDNDDDQKLLSSSRPTRKASKKAMEEMARETQRISRNMQLTHEAKTRKKITKESLLARFKPKSSNAPTVTEVQATSSSIAGSSMPGSDIEGSREQGTPLTTPERPQGAKPSQQPPVTLVPETSLLRPDDENEELPGIDEILSSQPTKQEQGRLAGYGGEDIRMVGKSKSKGKDPNIYPVQTSGAGLDQGTTKIYPATTVSNAKGKNKDPEYYSTMSQQKKAVFTQRPIKFRLPTNLINPNSYLSDTDSDLEILPSKQKPNHAPKHKISSIFANLPSKSQKENHSASKFRALAQLSSQRKQLQHRKPGKASLTTNELGTMLQRQARHQAARERAERIEELKRKGVVIQTSEERAQDQLAVEDMIERARKEAEALAKKEKEEVKEEKREKGELDGFGDSEDEDEEYVEAGDQGVEEGLDTDEEDEEGDVELSGSEEEDGGEEEGDEEKEEEEIEDEDAEERAAKGANGLVDDIASESDEEEEHEDEVLNETENGFINDDAPDEEEAIVPQLQRRSKTTRVVDDDDEEADNPQATPKPTAVLDSPAAIQNPFGEQNDTGAAPMGLTQAFAATVADSQLATQEDDSLAALGPLTAPDFPDPEVNSIIRDSVARDTQELDIDLHLTQSQILPDSVPLERAVTQPEFSQLPDPSQDEGFEKSSPIIARFAAAPPSTVDTVIVPRKEVSESPTVKRKGRLRRRVQEVAVFSDEEQEEDEDAGNKEEANDDGFAITANAFDALKKGSKKARKREELFNKEKSEAKEMFEEQAAESEDEYAGLGGASDDSEGEVDDEVRRMIDESDVKVNESKMAAFFAEKSRASDEAAANKLYKDLMTGAFRRKRGAGAGFDDLDDSDDDVEARQRRKRREFAQMRKALVEADSNVGKIAEDPKKAAFLRAIEDHDDAEEENDDAIFLQDTPADGEEEGEETQEIIPDSQAENRDPTASVVDTSTGTGVKSTNPSLKRKRTADTPLSDSRPHPSMRTNPRRTGPSLSRKPATLAEIRHSVSSLLEEPHSLLSNQPSALFEPSSDAENEASAEFADPDLDAEVDDNVDLNFAVPYAADSFSLEAAQTSVPETPTGADDMASDTPNAESQDVANTSMAPPLPRKHPRRTAPNAHPVPAFIDRLSLKRSSSSFNSSTDTLAGARAGVSESGSLAFFTAASAARGSFKTPALIRKATSAFSAVLEGDGNGRHGGVEGRGVGRAGGGKRASVNWYKREEERKGVVERRREKERGKLKGKGVVGDGGRGASEGMLESLLGRGNSWGE